MKQASLTPNSACALTCADGQKLSKVVVDRIHYLCLVFKTFLQFGGGCYPRRLTYRSDSYISAGCDENVKKKCDCKETTHRRNAW